MIIRNRVARAKKFEAPSTIGELIKWVEEGEREGYGLDTWGFDEGLELDDEGITVHMVKFVDQEVGSK